MCDTLFKANGDVRMFAKNSDRGCNEPNLTVYIPRRTGDKDKPLRLTYVEIEDVETSFATCLVKPSWLWGAEMGVNEFGLCVGNEAVFTKTKQKKPSVIGMDYVRLVLERGESAERGVEVLLDLLQKYGQGGNCGFDHAFFYDNSYLLADGKDAYIVETAAREYAVKRLVGEGNISNRLSITTDADKSSIGAQKNFKRTYSDLLFTYFSKAAVREQSVRAQLSAIEVPSAEKLTAILRSHTKDKGLYTGGSVGSVCMHQSALGDHTTGSMCASLVGENRTIWLTGCSTPCLAVYKPTYFGAPIAPVFECESDSLFYWLDREYLFRAIYSGLVDEDGYKKKACALQADFFAEEAALQARSASKEEFIAFSRSASLREQTLVEEYRSLIEKLKKDSSRLSREWQKRTESLGQNVFSRELKERTGK